MVAARFASRRCASSCIIPHANDAALGRPSTILALMRAAFTIVELLVAIVVLTAGMLALAATAGLVASHLGDGEQLSSAAHAAESVLDSLTSQRCNALVSGEATRAGIAVQWTVQRDSTIARVDLIVIATLRRRGDRRTYEAIVPCSAS